jgi:anti-anti-sigma factor
MLNIRTQKLSNTTILHCVGRVTFPYADALRTATLPECQAACLVLDFAQVTDIDAAGLGVLVSLRSWSKSSGSKSSGSKTSGRMLKLMNVNPKVQSLFELTRLKSTFEICSPREMLDLLCRAIHEPETKAFVPSFQAASCAGQLLSPA